MHINKQLNLITTQIHYYMSDKKYDFERITCFFLQVLNKRFSLFTKVKIIFWFSFFFRTY